MKSVALWMLIEHDMRGPVFNRRSKNDSAIANLLLQEHHHVEDFFLCSSLDTMNWSLLLSVCC